MNWLPLGEAGPARPALRDVCRGTLPIQSPSNNQEDVIATRLRLGDLLILAKLVTEADVAQALERLVENGGRLGDNLVAIGAISQEKLHNFLHRIPTQPNDIKATRLD